MGNLKLDSGNLPFQTEGRLLQELGERLVASPEVALVELVKNAYDADSPSCSVRLVNQGKMLIVEDRGHGMAYDEFESRWMRIATSNKADIRVSRKFGRRLTGQKGIGRFAVRSLGNYLRLETVAFDKKRGCKTRLIAAFNWRRIDKAQDLGKARIPYRLVRAGDSEPIGTTLTIRQLKEKGAFVKTSTFRASVLKIVTPIAGLERNRFGQTINDSNKDPGFRVTLPGDAGDDSEELDLAAKVLNHSWARLTIDLNKNSLTLHVTLHNGTKHKTLRFPFRSVISEGLFADIRFFPRRAGVFRAHEVNGKVAWEWVRENCGVAVVDHGFRVKPYGFPEDDWLFLDADSAHNERDWRTNIAKQKFPISRRVKADPALNPMLNLPTNYQLVGAVFVESKPPSVSRATNDLTPSMDREGFLNNEAFKQLVNVVRAGIEYLAHEDKDLLLTAKIKQAKEAAQQTKKEFKAAIEYIQKSPTLTKADKARLVQEYSGLAKRIDEVEEYEREARRKLEIMSSLGVVAGFMTHEATRIVASLGEALTQLRKLAKQYPSLSKKVAEIEHSYEAFRAHTDYTRTFVDAVQEGVASKFKAVPQVRRIIDKFGSFAKDRDIDVVCEIDEKLDAPEMPVALYSGVLLNLYTNALKAILAAKHSKQSPRIVFRGWNDTKSHTVEVLDTGIGIPPDLRRRIWDPLFTTTSRLNNPLGSGMGLGLTLVNQLVRQIGGRIEVVDAPAEFSTCFRVEFPLRNKT